MPFDKQSRWSESDATPQFQPAVPGKSTVSSRLPLMRAARDGNGVAEGADAAVDRAAGSSGQALPADLRGRFESSLGADLSSVRIHTGAESAQAADAVGAKAYTTGQDIHFGAGYYDASSAFGVHLLAHEVAHTVQQQGGAARRQHKLEVSGPADSAEVEADRAADAMVSGSPFAVGSHGGGWLGRIGEDKTGKGALTISTKGLKLAEEASMKLGSVDIGEWATLEATGTLMGEQALEWSKANKEVGVTIAGSYNGSKDEGGLDTTGKFDWTPYQNKVREKIHDATAEHWKDGFDVTEKKLTIETPSFKYRPEAIQVVLLAGTLAYTFANKSKVSLGLQLTFKGGKGVKPTDQGLQGTVTGELPLISGEMDVDDVKIKGKLALKLEGKLKPNWINIGTEAGKKITEWISESAVETAEGTAAASTATAAASNGTATAAQGAATATGNGTATAAQGAATTAEGASGAAQGTATATEGVATAAEGAAETAAGTAEAAGGAALAEAVVAVGGGLLIIGTMAYALASGAQDLADAQGVVLAANQARDSWAAGYCSGLGAVRAAPDMAAYGQGMTAGRAKLAATLAQMRAHLAGTPATDEELKAELATLVNEKVGEIFPEARKSMANEIATRFVQAFYSQHAAKWFGKVGLNATTRDIATRLGVSWFPPADDAADAAPAAEAPAPSQPLENPGDAPGTCDSETSSCEE